VTEEVNIVSLSPSTVAGIERRARDYWEIDGVPDFVGGMIYLLFIVSGMALILSIRHVSGYWSVLLSLLATLLLYATGYYVLRRPLERNLVEHIKAVVTYPRTGYVTPLDLVTESPEPFVPTILEINQSRFTTARRNQNQNVALRVARAALSVACGIWGWPLVILLLTGRSWFVPLEPWVFVGLGIAVGLRHVKDLSKNRFFGIDILGFPALGLVVMLLFEVQQPGIGRVLAVVGPGFIVIVRSTLTLLRYVHCNPLPKT